MDCIHRVVSIGTTIRDIYNDFIYAFHAIIFAPVINFEHVDNEVVIACAVLL